MDTGARAEPPKSGASELSERFYGELLAEHGPTPKGVGWNSTRAQELRFAELLTVCEGAKGAITLNDYGCGYGALYAYLRRRGLEFTYTGFDVLTTMLEQAHALHGDASDARFTAVEDELEPADFTVASGLFDRPFGTAEGEWLDHVLATIERLAAVSREGFAFNMLTAYSDRDRIRGDLYYGDPTFFFDHCMRAYGRRVSLLHHYELFDFTVIVLLQDRSPPPSEEART